MAMSGSNPVKAEPTTSGKHPSSMERANPATQATVDQVSQSAHACMYRVPTGMHATMPALHVTAWRTCMDCIAGISPASQALLDCVAFLSPEAQRRACVVVLRASLLSG